MDTLVEWWGIVLGYLESLNPDEKHAVLFIVVSLSLIAFYSFFSGIYQNNMYIEQEGEEECLKK